MRRWERQQQRERCGFASSKVRVVPEAVVLLMRRRRRERSPTSRRWLAAVACLVVGVVVVGASAPGQDDDRDERGRIWAYAVRTHTPGLLDQAATTLASWSRGELGTVAARVSRLAAPDDPNTFVRRAVMLHTDIAVLSHAEGGYRLPPSDREVVGIADGQHHAVRIGTVHWAVARQLVQSLSRPATDPFARRWYEATAAQLQSWSEYSELVPHLAAGLRLFEDDARLLLYRGAMHEDYAGPRVQSAVGGTPRLPAPLGGPMGPLKRAPAPEPAYRQTDELNAAEADLRTAVSLDPALAEAHLRLGHVLGEKGRHEDAAAVLVTALDTPGLTVDLQYDGWLLLGRERAALDDNAGAAEALARAAALVPGAQSAHLALSWIARASGDRRRAVEALQILSTDPTTDDPWWAYTRAHAPAPEALLDDLRRSLASPGRKP